MANKKHKAHKAPAKPRMPLEYTRAVEMIEAEQYDDALDLLLEADDRSPGNLEILEAMIHVGVMTENYTLIADIAPDILRIKPDDPRTMFALGVAYSGLGQPISSYLTFEKYSKYAEDDESLDSAREFIEELGADIPLICKDYDLPDEHASYVKLQQLERVEWLVSTGGLAEAHTVIEALLEENPGWPVALASKSALCLAEGAYRSTVDLCEQILEKDPNNFGALAFASSASYLSGEFATAKEYLARMEAIEKADLREARIASVYAYFGDYEAIAAAYKRSCVNHDESQDDSTLHHLAAVATASLGDEKLAREYWKAALEADDENEHAHDNLSDLTSALDDRNGPYAYGMYGWLPYLKHEDELIQCVQYGEDAEEATKIARDFVNRHPEIAAIAPLMMERSDSDSRLLLMFLAEFTEKPELIDATKAFALGTNGSAPQRMAALNVAFRAGVLDDAPQRFWTNGAWAELTAGAEGYAL